MRGTMLFAGVAGLAAAGTVGAAYLLLPTPATCWTQYITDVNTCITTFQDIDPSTNAQRATCLQGATASLMSCLGQVPPATPPTGLARCFLQLIADINDCRAKFNPATPPGTPNPVRDAYNECLKGAIAKHQWCLARKPDTATNANTATITCLNVTEPIYPEAEEVHLDFTLATDAGSVDVDAYVVKFFLDDKNEVQVEYYKDSTISNAESDTYCLNLPLSNPLPENGDFVLVLVANDEGDDIGAEGVPLSIWPSMRPQP